MNNRSSFAKKNIYVTFLCQILTMICGIIVPRIMITTYGSELYGATSSIAQFLSYITLAEGGICGVARAALYKPLAQGDNKRISQIVTEIKSFFRVIGIVFFIYVIILACSFKYISKLESYDWISTFLLVIVISISTFAQYFIGISYSVLLQAAQRTYITNIVNIIGTIVNTILIVILAYNNFSLIFVKLVSGCVFALKPIALYLFTNRLFEIEHTKSKEVILKDKWVALGQHLAYFLHSHTDIAVLTVLSNLKLVAVYSVYNLVISAIQNLMSSFSTGMESLFGDMYAKKEQVALQNTFSLYETLISIVSVVLFSTTSAMIIPFVTVYTKGVTDTNYIYPAFGILLTVAALLFALRSPYHSVIMAAGHFRQTNIAAYGEAIINIVTSIILVFRFGLIGVAIGTVSAVSFRFINYVYYLSNHILHRRIILFVRRFGINAILFAAINIISSLIFDGKVILDYFSWVMNAVLVFAISSSLTLMVNYWAYKGDVKRITRKILNRS